MVQFLASWHRLLLGAAAYQASRQCRPREEGRDRLCQPLPGHPAPLPSPGPGWELCQVGSQGVRPLGVRWPGQGLRGGPGFLTCSPGPQKGALGPEGKAGRNLYIAGVGGLVLWADRALSGETDQSQAGLRPRPSPVWLAPPHQHCLGVGSAGHRQMCQPPTWGAVVAPGLVASHPAGPGCPWTGRGHGQWWGEGGPGLLGGPGT